jgi:LmbE family N-acetylglucosaminyl deacetylase
MGERYGPSGQITIQIQLRHPFPARTCITPIGSPTNLWERPAMDDTPLPFDAVADRQNLLVLATAPGDERLYCGGLIAEACRRGRPPFVAILTDGSHTAAPDPDAIATALARASRDATVQLGVPDDWFLMLGLHDGTAPRAGRKFDAVVGALALITWRRDCNALVAPAAGDDRPDYAACHMIACAIAATTGIGLVTYPTAPTNQSGRPLVMRPSLAQLTRTERYTPIRPVP